MRGRRRTEEAGRRDGAWSELAGPRSPSGDAHPGYLGGLAHALPIRRGERVLILGDAPALAESVAERGAEPVCRTPEGVGEDAPPGLAEEELDHAFVLLAGGPVDAGHALAAVRRVLRRGAGLFLGVRRRRLLAHAPNAWTSAGGRRVLEEAGFDGVEVYGVRPVAYAPRFLVPLDHPSVLHWFVRTACRPVSVREAFVVATFARAPSRRVALALFPELAFLARRKDEGAW